MNRQRSFHLAFITLATIFFIPDIVSAKIQDTIKTHPAFKGAPRATYTSYQAKQELHNTTGEQTFRLRSADGILVHGEFVHVFDVVFSGKKQNVQYEGTKELMLGGLIAVESTWTKTIREKNKLAIEYVSQHQLLSIYEVTGHLFPLAVGNRMSFKAQSKYSSKQRQPKSEWERTSINEKEYAFVVTQVISGKGFTLSLPGKLYKIEMVERNITEDGKKRIQKKRKQTIYYSEAYGLVVGRERYSNNISTGDNRSLRFYLTSIKGTPSTGSPERIGKTLIDKSYIFRLKVKAKGKLMYVFDAGSMLIVTDRNGKILRDSSLQNRAAFAVMINRQWLNDYELNEYKRYQKLVKDFINMETKAQIALFFRDTAAKMMVDVGVAYMTGDPNQFTKQVAKSTLKKAAKETVKDTIKSMIKDPDSYLRAMAMSMLKKAGKELGDIERQARRLRSATADYETFESFDREIRATYEKVVPAMVLIQGLRPGADVKSQLKSILTTMESRLKDQIPGNFDLLPASKKKNVYSNIGRVIDELYKRYKPYKAYQKELKKYQGLSNKGNSTRRTHYIEKIKYGNTETKGYSHFSNQ